jgi:oligopeptide transport system ATP-binding protein
MTPLDLDIAGTPLSTRDEECEPLLSVKNLRTEFDMREGTLLAVDDVSFDIQRGEIFSIVGESGSGKTVTAMSIMGLIAPPGKIVSGSIHFDGQDLRSLSERDLRAIRGSEISMIFQDAMTALNPVYSIGDQVSEALRRHRGYNRKESLDAAVEALRKVGIADADKRIRDHPHEFSGGMRQRAMIAMAMITEPKLLIADEPTTALDVTIQAQILELILKITEEQGTSVLLISHDLGVVASISDQMMVMYGGQVHESGSAEQVFTDPHGPYTWGLLASVPRLDSDLGKVLDHIPGRPPSLTDIPPGCHFHPRCMQSREVCGLDAPTRISAAEGHDVLCHFAAEPQWSANRVLGVAHEGSTHER